MGLIESMAEVGLIVGLVIVGYLMGRFARPKVFHGHVMPVSQKSAERVAKKRLPSKISQAFSHSRRPKREKV